MALGSWSGNISEEGEGNYFVHMRCEEGASVPENCNYVFKFQKVGFVCQK